MGSETGAKWLILLVLYFTFMTVIVTLVSDITPIPYEGGYDILGDPSNISCGLPRTTYQLDIEDGGSEWYVNEFEANTPDWVGNIECEYSVGQLSNTSCESIAGCSWDDGEGWWFFPDTEPSCVGTISETWIDPTDVSSFNYIGSTMDYIVYDDGLNSTGLWEDRPIQGICGYDEVIDNQTRCLQMSCTWGLVSHQIDYFNANDISFGNSIIDLSMGKKVFNVVKEMITFKFDFGFENETSNFILNFLIFWLPLIGVALALYVMVRS